MQDKKELLQQRFVKLAHHIERLYKRIDEKDLGDNLQILRTTLKSLSTITSAWALASASPSLSIALERATADIATTTEKRGLIGPHLDALLEGTVDGLLASVDTGPRAELKEMAELRAMLTDLRDGAMKRRVFLAKRPDIVLKLEKYGIIPPVHQGGASEGCAKLWAKEATPPYDEPEYQAIAERLPVGWEELTNEKMDTVLKQLDEAIAQKSTADPDIPNVGEIASMKKTVKLSLLFVMMMAHLIEEQGTGLLPKSDEEEKKRANQFGFEMLLHLLNGSSFVAIFFKKLSRGISSDENSQKRIAEVLTTLTLLLAILAASKGDEFRLKGLLLSFKSSILERLEAVDKWINEALAAQSLTGSTPETLALVIRQARIALEKEDFEVLFDLYRQLLQLLNITPQQLNDDLKATRRLAERMQAAFTTGMEDETNKLTTLSQTM